MKDITESFVVDPEGCVNVFFIEYADVDVKEDLSRPVKDDFDVVTT